VELPDSFSPHQRTAFIRFTRRETFFSFDGRRKSWQAISPDLTRNDKSKQVSTGGEITKDNTSVEYYDTIFTVAESPVTQGVIWAGSDDGLVHVSRDNGGKWENVTPKGMPEWIQINAIDASPLDAERLTSPRPLTKPTITAVSL
jgi:hypothetical protein